MKLETSFTDSTTCQLKLLGSVFIAINIVLIIFIATLYYKGTSQQIIIDNLGQQKIKIIGHIEQQQSKLSQHLTNDNFTKLKKNIYSINQIDDLNSLDISTILNIIESSLPKDVFIEEFFYDSKRGESTVTAQSITLVLLTQFVEKLQENSNLTQIDLVNQKQLASKRSTTYQYQIKIQHEIIRKIKNEYPD